MQRIRRSAALQIAGRGADLREDRRRRREMPRFAHVGGAHDGDFFRRETEALHDTRAHRGRRNERLRSGTQKHGNVNAPVLEQYRARVVARARGDGVRRFEAIAARDVDHRNARKFHGRPAFAV